jgi:RNA polymerase sigma-70 factor, ECF subfamily
LDPETDPKTGTFMRLVRKQRRAILNDCRGKLPRDSRTVLALRYDRDLTFMKIGLAMDRTEGAVSQLHYRALDDMRELLAVKKVVRLRDVL